ncbi:transcriptional regulator [Auraticoccus sp. F435]|uniref:Transcriptional regulator n=1 Tax=Auraticoccus cholistanensis TaxID=2656650 RepID=A0A6A9UQX2_9ACTN|nr:transcriptional regulator [Auraticoccus cholistanensis]MVA75143.1 transcriptional regulator [Auraticoccus cholistanensis]
MGHDVAVPAGVDAARLARALLDAHDAFLATGAVCPTIRPVVLDSWRRSIAEGLDPERDLPPLRLDEDALAEIRAAHPLRTAMPVIRRLLVDSATEAGLLVAVSDAVGQLLWVEGAPHLRSRAERVNFVAGADWSECSAGTNAPGTALALGRPVQLLGPEHLVRPVTPWSCSAAPIHDPDTGAVLGVLDVTGGPEVASAQSLGLVWATVAAVEAELRIERLSPPGRRPPARPGPRPARLDVLGCRAATLHHGSSTTRLSLRHSELLLLVATAPEGLTASQLAVALSEEEQADVTIRAEMSRLRTVLGDLALRSRPYRLAGSLELDVRRVRRHLAAGALRRAVAAYRGPVLPDSEAPAVVRLRRDLHRQLRSALLAGDDPDALLSFADTEHGRDDLEVWQRALECLPAGSPRAAEVAAHVAALDAELG